MSLTVIGVRHHSPACARLVGATIAALRPAHVLIEGPADMNQRIGELLLGHELPVAIFTSYADERRRHGSWAPFCEYSPEWEALRAARECGAETRFIDLPAWHEAFADRDNRYADAELRYAEAVGRLCESFGVDNSDALWDHVVEMGPGEGLAERLTAYFDVIRGDAEAGPSDTAREAYMARWIRAALADAGDRPVVAVVGGFHRPALLRLTTASAAAGPGWPEIPQPPDGATARSYLVPYSFRRLDAFGGYQSGMPSPEYYQQLWESGPEQAARHLVTAVAERLRKRGQAVSTADLIAARAGAEALARLRGHSCPARVDVLDGLAAALVSEALDVPLPWAVRGTVTAGQHPAVIEMTAALSGDRHGRLHPDTPLPPLVHAATAELERHGLDRAGEHGADLLDPRGREISRVLHRLRVLAVPGFRRITGPATGIDPVLAERWTVQTHEQRLTALIEAGGYGPTLETAAAARIAECIDQAAGDLGALAGILFDAALCGVTDLGEDVPERLRQGVAAGSDLAVLGRVLAVTLALWRHDRLLGTAGSEALAVVVAAATRRILWLAEGWHAAGAPADRGRIAAVAAVRDAVLHAAAVGVDRVAAVEVAARVTADRAAPPDLRGAFYGLGHVLAESFLEDPAQAVRGAFAAGTAGDWLAGLFGVAREPVLAPGGVLGLLDELVTGFGAEDFLVALPALRQAFEYFPPRERETIGERLMAHRGVDGYARDLLRTTVPAEIVAAGLALDETVERRLAQAGLISAGETR
ncbi:hypothetical protein Aca07nite_21230 [Actinoplanes capillaceus]|uniref:Uncharacterized protein n=1 Tax=Actinoplanes campanulatus TaxID=113559 RepID=A0ABQ3WG56_9ACTN|nr:DUF5682 family protein [Actinoplanes capillaceus]GID44848.1 hypothetical protein Aca07nite_21230 [Actinoplanes capillaceus]